MWAVTIYPEWVWAILRLSKDCENRGFSPRKLKEGERLALHAGKYVGGRPAKDARQAALDALVFMARRAGWQPTPLGGLDMQFDRNGDQAVLRFDEIQRSAVVAVATLAGARRNSDSPWGVPGQIHWGLADVVELPKPVRCPGERGLWSLPPVVEVPVMRQLAA
jgi:hypothetical protein